MKNNEIGKEFNVANPTKDNIEYAFKNLFFYLIASTSLKIYEDKNEEFKKVIEKVKGIFKIYIEQGNLVIIAEEKLEDIKFDLIDLDTDTKTLNSYYAEWSLMWLEALISLRRTENKIGGVK
ncbi:MAG TPA: hypothetical protein GX708_19200 [Gallicola sp.]|nr:hypothetical protein [Gallicola sp.]